MTLERESRLPERRPGSRAASNLAALTRSGRLPALLVVAACGVVLYGFFASPDFRVDTVVVRGVALGAPEEIEAVAGTLKEPVVAVDSAAVAARVAQLPTVERAAVRAEFPDRVVITVVERTPALVWQASGVPMLVDARGNVLRAGDRPDLPRLALEGSAPVVGARAPVERVVAALAITNALVSDLRELSWSDAQGFKARRRDGKTIVLGDASKMPLKLAALDAAMRLSGDWTILDVSEPDRPYWK